MDSSPVPHPPKFPVLERPPIVEVVCGIVFEPLDLDGMVLGVYWDGRKAEYPSRSLQAAFSDNPVIILGSPLLRALLVSADKVRVLQLQHDRFFMNWRALGSNYPRFSSLEGAPGLLFEALAEFGKLSDFCLDRFGKRPVPLRVELSKIDIIERDKHWTDLDDLARIVPLTGTFKNVHSGGSREFNLQFVEREGTTSLVVGLSSVSDHVGGEMRATRIEARALHPIAAGEDIQQAFTSANDAVNKAFFQLINPVELERFGKVGEAV